MRRIRYQVAMSLDGYIADAQHGADWIVMDPDIDFGALFSQFDTFLMGRRTYEQMKASGQAGSSPGARTFVFSRTLAPRDHPGVTLLADGCETQVAAMRQGEGKDIWLFGGGDLFRSLLAVKLVDSVEVAVVPILLGGGVPLLAPPAAVQRLRLTGHRLYTKSGIMLLEYAVDYATRVKVKKARPSARR